jgi:hypothetical protein
MCGTAPPGIGNSVRQEAIITMLPCPCAFSRGTSFYSKRKGRSTSACSVAAMASGSQLAVALVPGWAASKARAAPTSAKLASLTMALKPARHKAATAGDPANTAACASKARRRGGSGCVMGAPSADPRIGRMRYRLYRSKRQLGHGIDGS